ncbi:hypothetical protein GYMLUDRAFT_676191 [Collybiopsis luxurians FD-317 M1]|uniref:Uncharacterized protein n=1 Tax=Collybiopsis luxurians FD-317 M1 TaxID=944289 RepID=A0A0D0CL65_9AGAR|nr:hypothetical protein GYMLUDRAFT_676191 [Collybiopsis luxurians FD-317 M1]
MQSCPFLSHHHPRLCYDSGIRTRSERSIGVQGTTHWLQEVGRKKEVQLAVLVGWAIALCARQVPIPDLVYQRIQNH